MRVDGTTAMTGGVFVLIGGFFLIVALKTLRLGTAFQMGPGYFPAVVAAILVLLGVWLLVVSTSAKGEAAQGHVPWRSIALIVAAPAFFALTIRGVGLIGSVALTSLIASAADRGFKPLQSIVLAGGLAVGSYLLFNQALDVPLPAFGGWLRFGQF